MKSLALFTLLTCTLGLSAQTRLYTGSENKRMLFLLDSTHDELIKVTHAIPASKFFFQIDSTTWSPNDIIEHLGLIDEGYSRELWFTLSQPAFTVDYTDSTKDGDQKALAYATQPEKGKARGTNLPRNRYCNPQTCIRIFTEANEQVKQFYTINAAKDLRRYFIFRSSGNGPRTIRDAHQLGLLLVAHRIRHIGQLKRLISDPRFQEMD